METDEPCPFLAACDRELSWLHADVAECEQLLVDRPETDVFGRVSFEARIIDGKKKIAAIERGKELLLAFSPEDRMIVFGVETPERVVDMLESDGEKS